LLRDVFPKD